jgi:hypothetical protein
MRGPTQATRRRRTFVALGGVAALIVVQLAPWSSSPPTPSEVVHRAAQATLASPDWTALAIPFGTYANAGGTRRLVFRPDHTVIGVDMNGSVPEPATLFTYQGASERSFLAPVTSLLEMNNFVTTGGQYRGTIPVRDLLATPADDVAGLNAGFTVTLRHGYVGSVTEQINLESGGRSLTVGLQFNVTRLTPPSNS